PECGHEQYFRFDQLKWDPESRRRDQTWDLEKVASSAYYECENDDCKAHWKEDDRHTIVRSGRWKPTASGIPGYRSYAIVGPMVALQSSDFGSLAVDFLSSRTTGFFKDRQ